MEVKLIRITKDPIMAIETAASKCYDSTPSPDGKIMDHCIKSGHTSVLEHCTFSFEISGVSRALLAQITRHRIASFSVRSQRYVNSSGFKYITPPSIKHNAELNEKYEEMMNTINDWYNYFQSHGIPNEDARMVLPNACETVLVVTFNFRSLINFFNERLCTRAQWEIRGLAHKMKKCVEETVPQFTDYMCPKCEKYGKDKSFCTEAKSCGRHPKLKDIMESYYNYQDMCNS